MIESTAPYDEIGSRTRQAWLRTSMGATAVCLFLLRGLALSGAPGWVMAAALLPEVALVTVTVIRMRTIQHGPSAAAPVSLVMLTVVAVCGIAAAAAVPVPFD